MKIFANFLHYYETRGKAELHSFLATFISSFGMIFVTIGYADLLQLTAGVFTAEVMMALSMAAARSAIAAFLYSIWPDKFAIRSIKK